MQFFKCQSKCMTGSWESMHSFNNFLWIYNDFKIKVKNAFSKTDIENRLMDMGRGEERVRCMERVT